MLIILGLLFFCYLVNQGPLRQTKLAALLMFSAAVFVMGWRSVTYTGDNIAYAEFYQLYSQLTLQESWENVIQGVLKDPFFYFLGNVFSKLGFTYRGWFVFIAVVFMGGFCYLMYKRSRNYSLSMFFLITLGYFYFSMTGLRQAMAFGLCYIAFEFVCQRKILPFLIFTAAAGLLHSSAFVFLIMYPLSFVKVSTGKYITIGLSAILIALLFPGLLSYLVQNLAWNDHLAIYGERTSGLTMSGYFIQMAILLFCMWIYSRRNGSVASYGNLSCATNKSGNSTIQATVKKENSPSFVTGKTNTPAVSDSEASSDCFLKYGLTALSLGVFFQAFAINIDNFFRISMYFSGFAPIILPKVLEILQGGERIIVLIIIMTICFGFMLHGRAFTYFTMFESLPYLN